MREFICINCPLGCQLKVDDSDLNNIKVTGNTCKRGERYGIDEVLNNNNIDIAILDSVVTTLDYVELAKKVKISNKEANVIFITEDEELYNGQNNGYVLKPVDEEKISKAVEELVYPKKVRVNKTVN